MLDAVLIDIKERLRDKNIHEVRTVARAVGVSSPTEGKKDDIIADILAIATCEIDPAPRSTRGAPPKSSDYDEELVADILRYREQCAAINAEGANSGFEVSDGTSYVRCAGILDKNYLRVKGCLPDSGDVYVGESFINRFKLRDGDFIEGSYMRKQPSPMLVQIVSVNGYPPQAIRRRDFAALTPIYPKKRIHIANSQGIVARQVDLFAPVGYGQRAVISAPANSCKTELLKQIASGIASSEEASVIIFVVAGSPEEVTDLSRSAEFARVFHTDFYANSEEHVRAAEFIARYCKTAVESEEDVVLIVDGLSKLGAAAKHVLSSAICAEEGGSLTVIATVCAEGEYSSEYSAELLGAANMRVTLLEGSSQIPAIDVSKTYTLNCGLLQSDREQKTADILRKQYKQTGDLTPIAELLKKTENNTEIIDKNG